MSTIQQFMETDHRACDDEFVALENAAASANWSEASAAAKRFVDAVLSHFAMEEEALFPTFEQATGMVGGPTAMMRMEHEQMRAMFSQMTTAIETEDQGQVRGLAETLMVLTQQHNMKEEQVLYPMTDQALPNTAEVIAQMQAARTRFLEQQS